MTSNIFPYVNDENTHICSRNGIIKGFKTPTTTTRLMTNVSKSEPKPFLSDSSNGKWGSRGGLQKQENGSRQVTTEKVSNRSQKDNDDSSPVTPALNLEKMLNEMKRNECCINEENETVAVQNDDIEFPDDFEDIWPVAERPTLAEFKWLVTWDIYSTGKGLFERQWEEDTREPVLTWAEEEEEEEILLFPVEKEEVAKIEPEPFDAEDVILTPIEL